MSAIVTIKIVCDTPLCGAFRVMETESRTTARRMLQRLGWKVVLKHNATNQGSTKYGDLCPDCPQEYRVTPWRYSDKNKPQHTAAAVIGNALPKRKR